MNNQRFISDWQDYLRCVVGSFGVLRGQAQLVQSLHYGLDIDCTIVIGGCTSSEESLVMVMVGQENFQYAQVVGCSSFRRQVHFVLVVGCFAPAPL